MSTKQSPYKSTVHLPQTAFPMKAELAQREPQMLAAWESQGLYANIRSRSRGKKKYILHDGPPYANGRIHIGHALNKILKDIIVKYYTMKGHDALYVPGWDCHGLPIEHQCLKDMGKRKEEVERVAFRKQARAYAEKFIGIQREEFKRLGVFGEWEKPYLTMDYDYQACIAESFLKLYEKGYIYQSLKPVPWCFDCETALADAELEYEDRPDSAIFVKFLIDKNTLSSTGSTSEYIRKSAKLAYLVIWTTTPWTLPANAGAAVHPDLIYNLIENQDEILIVSSNYYIQKSMALGVTKPPSPILEGKNLVGTEYKHPFLNRTGKVIAADYVSATDGTGIVHIAPGHGEADYVFGHIKNKLEILSPIDEKGRFTKEFPACEGTHVFKANAKIIELLKEKKALLHEEPVQHSYPHCWRCKKPIIFRATKQWFMKIDHDNLRQNMLTAIRSQIKFTPDWGKNRIGSMVETRPEWCLSRQRYWGVPIPIIYCAGCGQHFVKETKNSIIQLFQQYGADIWFQKSAIEFFGGITPQDNLQRIPTCCGSPDIRKVEDIIDVWFDSGVSHQAVLKKSSELKYPADLYLEGSDQHRGWFQSALTTAVALDGKPPFDGVLTHGFVVDGEGKKMSKSAGNVVAPQDVMKEYGADILRLWVSSCDYQYDVRCSKEILTQLADAYRKIRNTFRHLLGNLHDFNPQIDQVPIEKLHPLDQWAVEKTINLTAQADEWYRRFDFHQIFGAVYQFCSVDLSSYYFDVLKDTLYTAHERSHLRRSAQTAFFHVLKALVKILAPILSFTADEVWKSFPIEEGVPSVHASFLDAPRKIPASPSFMEWERIRQLRDAIMPFLEKKREAKLIGSSLDAKIYLSVSYPELARAFQKNLSELARVFVASHGQVFWMDQVRPGSEETACSFSGFSDAVKIFVSVERADGVKCERCWNYSLQVGSFSEHPALCERCVEAIALK